MDVESRYDQYIAPLMAQIIAICQNEGIPMGATFQLSDGDHPLYVTTTIPTDWESEHMKQTLVFLGRDVPYEIT